MDHDVIARLDFIDSRRGKICVFRDTPEKDPTQFFSQGTKGNLLVVDALLDLCISQHRSFQFSAMSTQRDPDRPDAVPGTVHYEQRHGLEPESYTSRKLVCVL